MTKIEALKQTIYNLENNIYEYNWWKFDSCNCGILARTIMGGKTANETGAHDFGVYGGFSSTVKNAWNHCELTGIPLPEVFKVFKSCGFIYEELHKLELCALEKDGLVKYIKKWVKELEQQPREDITKQLAIIPLDRIDESPDIINNKILAI